jgi:hypothetical protein
MLNIKIPLIQERDFFYYEKLTKSYFTFSNNCLIVANEPIIEDAS